MRTLIFDIETVGEDWDDLDVTTKKSLTRWIDRTVHNTEERQARLKDIKQGLGFSPLTGFIVSIAFYDVDHGCGLVSFQGSKNTASYHENGFDYKVGSESDILKMFWQEVGKFQSFVTFNGRAFDAPFIIHRSLVHDITPTVTLVSRRYLNQQKVPYHIDLQDELTFYGAMQKKPGLHLFCRSYGIKTPKANMDGDHVSLMYRQKKYNEIARYNADDVVATLQLFRKWQTHLAPPVFQSKDMHIN